MIAATMILTTFITLMATGIALLASLQPEPRSSGHNRPTGQTDSPNNYDDRLSQVQAANLQIFTGEYSYP